MRKYKNKILFGVISLIILALAYFYGGDTPTPCEFIPEYEEKVLKVQSNLMIDEENIGNVDNEQIKNEKTYIVVNDKPAEQVETHITDVEKNAMSTCEKAGAPEQSETDTEKQDFSFEGNEKFISDNPKENELFSVEETMESKSRENPDKESSPNEQVDSTKEEYSNKEISSDNEKFSDNAENKNEENINDKETSQNIEKSLSVETNGREVTVTDLQKEEINTNEITFSDDTDDLVITDKELTCTLSVRCDTILNNIELLNSVKVEIIPVNGMIYESKVVPFYEGESVFNLLVREMKKNKIHLEFVNIPVYNSAYIEGIANIYEFDCGELSGWMYKVNGAFPNYGCSQYQLKDGDVVEWVYTCDLGNDIGGAYSARNGN